MYLRKSCFVWTAQAPRYSHSSPRAGPSWGGGRVGPGLTKQLTISSAHAATQIYACQEKENISPIPPHLIMYFLLTCVGGGNFLVKIKDAFFSFYCHILLC